MNRESVAATLEQQYPGLLRLLRSKLRDEQLAADVLNQALVTSLEHFDAGRIADPAAIAGYVFQVAMNQWRNHRRKFDERRDNKTSLEVLDHDTAHASTAENAFDTHLMSEVRALIQGLSTERDRQIVKRYYLDEDEKDTICRDLGLSPLHFDKVIFRARQRMKSLLEARGFRRSDFFVLLCCV